MVHCTVLNALAETLFFDLTLPKKAGDLRGQGGIRNRILASVRPSSCDQNPNTAIGRLSDRTVRADMSNWNAAPAPYAADPEDVGRKARPARRKTETRDVSSTIAPRGRQPAALLPGCRHPDPRGAGDAGGIAAPRLAGRPCRPDHGPDRCCRRLADAAGPRLGRHGRGFHLRALAHHVDRLRRPDPL